MRLKTFLSATLLAAGTFVLASAIPARPAVTAPVETESYLVDTGHSAILFAIRHLGVAYTYGRFDSFEGRIELADDPTQSSVTIEIKADSINSNSEQRDAHLKSPDFLNVKQFPVARFQSKQVIKQAKADVYAVTGDLEMHGKSKEVTINMELVGKRDVGGRFGYRAGFLGELTINRDDFAIGEKFPEETLSKEIKLTFSIEAIRQ